MRFWTLIHSKEISKQKIVKTSGTGADHFDCSIDWGDPSLTAYPARITLKSKYELNTSMIPTKTMASTVVIFLLTNSFISVLSFVIITSGIIGIGIIILSITWL
jgi:hypothetical protein